MEGSRVKTLGPRQRKMQLLHNCLQGNHWLRSREVAVGEAFPHICCWRNPRLLFSFPSLQLSRLKDTCSSVWLFPWIILQQTPSIVTLFFINPVSHDKTEMQRELLKNQKGKDAIPTELDSGDHTVSQLPTVCHSASHLKGYSAPTTTWRQKNKGSLAFSILFRRHPFSPKAVIGSD